MNEARKPGATESLTLAELTQMLVDFERKYWDAPTDEFGYTRHIGHHTGKLLGKLATYSERGEHNIFPEDVDHILHEEVIPDFLYYALGLARVHGIDLGQSFRDRLEMNRARVRRFVQDRDEGGHSRQKELLEDPLEDVFLHNITKELSNKADIITLGKQVNVDVAGKFPRETKLKDLRVSGKGSAPPREWLIYFNSLPTENRSILTRAINSARYFNNNNVTIDDLMSMSTKEQSEIRNLGPTGILLLAYVFGRYKG